MTWFAFKGYNNGQPIDVAGLQEKDLVGIGFHGYATAKDAIAHPNSVSIFQAPVLNAIIAEAHAEQSQQAGPGQPNASNLGGAVFAGAQNDIKSFLGSLGGSIGSGLESGIVALLRDLWSVIMGPLEMIGGVLLAILILLWAFREDLGSIVSAVGAAVK